jgi:hypothetical protein
MNTIQVKDMMVALDDYATVSEDATLYDAVIALENAQEQYEKSQYLIGPFLCMIIKTKLLARSASWICLWPLNPITKL